MLRFHDETNREIIMVQSNSAYENGLLSLLHVLYSNWQSTTLVTHRIKGEIKSAANRRTIEVRQYLRSDVTD